MEETKDGFWDKLRKYKRRQVIFFVVSMVVLVVAYVPTVLGIRKLRENEIINKMNVSADASVLSAMDKIENKNGILELSGWVFRLNSKNINIRLVLEAVDDSDAIILETEMKANVIPDYFNQMWDFGNCGFTAGVKENRLQAETCYEILLLLDYEVELENTVDVEIKTVCKKVSTKQYLYGGNIYPYNVDEFVTPTVSDSFLDEVLKNGTLCSYEPNGNMYIYQYKSKLFWFLRSDYKEIEINQYVPFHIHSSVVSDLPDEYEQYGFENRDFYFADNEMNLSGELYRVAIAELPQDYAITYVETGLYSLQSSTWIWNTRFQINVEEMKANE